MAAEKMRTFREIPGPNLKIVTALIGGKSGRWLAPFGSVNAISNLSRFGFGMTTTGVMGSNEEMMFSPVVDTQPYVSILEQPKARGLRFRYECEGRAAGSIPGENSKPEARTYPKIQINNSQGSDAIVVVSCVCKNTPYRPHPHRLVSKECDKGVCTVKLRKQSVATFPNLGIQCTKKKEVPTSLAEREQLRVDPFQTGFGFDKASIDLSVVRLCFQVFLPDSQGKFTRIVPPVVSQCIYDRKTVTDLVICRISRQAGSVRGGDDVYLLCEKVNKDDIEVCLYEENEDGIIWEARGDFGQQDVHRQYAIVFRTPPYRDQTIRTSRTVSLQLKRPSDNEKSEPLQFQYTPVDPDPYGLEVKRRKCLTNANYIQDTTSHSDLQAAGVISAKTEIRDRLLAKPRQRRIKQEDAQGDPREGASMSTAMEGMYINNTIAGGLALNQSVTSENPTMPGPSATVSSSEFGLLTGIDWAQNDIQTFTDDTMLPSMGAMADQSESAQSLLSNLAEGGNNSLQMDSGLLRMLQDESAVLDFLTDTNQDGS